MELDGGGLLSLPSPDPPLEITHHANMARVTWGAVLGGPGFLFQGPEVLVLSLCFIFDACTSRFIFIAFVSELPNGSLEWSLPQELNASYFALTLGSYCFPFAIIWASPQSSWVYLPISHWHVWTSVLHREPAGIRTLQPFSTPLHCCPVHSQTEFN